MQEIAELELKISNELIASINDHVMAPHPPWIFGHSSQKDSNRFPFWKKDFMGYTQNFEKVCPEPVLKLWKLIQEQIDRPELAPYRVYVNGSTYGNGGSAHIDGKENDEYTLLYYVHPNWDKGWGGETVFLSDDQEEIIKTIQYKSGKVVMFRANIPHYGRTPNRNCPELRTTLAFKLMPKNKIKTVGD